MNDDTNQRAREAAAGAAFEALAGKGADPFSMPETWDHAQAIADAVIATFATSAREEALREAVKLLEARAEQHEQDPVKFGGFAASRASEAWACANTVHSLITGGGERG